MQKLAARRIMAGFVLWMLTFSCAYATSPCYQWAGRDNSTNNYTGPWENSPQAAANDVLQHCENNPNACGSGGNCPPAGSNYVCSSYTFTLNGPGYYPFPDYFMWIYYVSTYVPTGTQHNLELYPQILVQNNPGGCDVFVTATPPPAAQCGRSCNAIIDPINPATGGMYLEEKDLGGDVPGLSFQRFYNSTSQAAGDISAGWRHTFSRNITPLYGGTTYQPYSSGGPNSSLFTSESSACTSGFAQIKSQVSTWASASASYSNGVCTLTVGSATIGTLALQYESPPTPDPTSETVIGYEAIRDDGQAIDFLLVSGVPTSPSGTRLKLQLISGGFSLTDAQDNVETYNSSGLLQSATTRAGVVQTMSYNSSNQLTTVTDNFGHSLTLTYNSQGALSSVTRQ